MIAPVVESTSKLSLPNVYYVEPSYFMPENVIVGGVGSQLWVTVNTCIGIEFATPGLNVIMLDDYVITFIVYGCYITQVGLFIIVISKSFTLLVSYANTNPK